MPTKGFAFDYKQKSAFLFYFLTGGEIDLLFPLFSGPNLFSHCFLFSGKKRAFFLPFSNLSD